MPDVHDTADPVQQYHPQPISNFGFSKSPVHRRRGYDDRVPPTAWMASMVEWYWDLGDGPPATFLHSHIPTAIQNLPGNPSSMNNHGCFSDDDQNDHRIPVSRCGCGTRQNRIGGRTVDHRTHRGGGGLLALISGRHPPTSTIPPGKVHPHPQMISAIRWRFTGKAAAKHPMTCW